MLIKMEVKEAIEFLMVVHKGKMYQSKYEGIISLLQEGEKYKQMWEEFKTIRFNTSDGHYHYGDKFTNMRIDDFQQFISKLEQKYLKGVTK